MYQKPKPKKTKSKKAPLIVVVLALLVSSAVYFAVSRKSNIVSYEKSARQLSGDEQPNTTKPQRQEIDAYTGSSETAPVRFYISRLGIVARIVSVDKQENGFPENTANIHDVAWLESSATPSSAQGIIVLSGYDYVDKQAGVFSQIKDLMVGDGILLEQGNGVKTSYIVSGVKQTSSDESVDKTLLASPPSSGVELRLTTSVNLNIQSKSGYQTRTIVTARKQ